MTIAEFKEKLETIYKTLFNNEFVNNGNSYFEVINKFVDSLPERKNDFFLSFAENEEEVIFAFASHDADLFMVKKKELEEDPIVSIKEAGNWTSYEFNLTTLLITEYVDWISSQTDNKFRIQFSGYGILVPVKKSWSQFFNPFSYPDKVWIGKEIKSVMLIQNETSTLTCITNDAATLKQAQQLIEEK
ncbi:hypothetical protein EG347_14720 [Chryseobacterium sp. G0186]|uniref:hypothetical protein n=1 Tax=Chryseobacterium sp. G0186 TaxID=2487064 RepID=UPI000F4DF3A6|nr:hypothetical protein [Chryseobacterium sp. G0186]AZA78672.1 hypothetical protein EG347_14720 [Chryseobacterium sp. G0186]